MPEFNELRVEVVAIENPETVFTSTLQQLLKRFAYKHYVIRDPDDFLKNILAVNKPGVLILYYSKRNQLVGFLRLARQSVQVNHRNYTVVLGSACYEPNFHLTISAARFGLTEGMKYKLEKPNEELVFFANANTPLIYQFLTELSPSILPCETIKTPPQVLALIQRLRNDNRWPTNPTHPMIIENQLTPREDNQIAQQNLSSAGEFYKKINPKYQDGCSLLVYLPINITTISESIKRIITKNHALMVTAP